MTILIIIKLLKILLGGSKEIILGEMRDDFDCVCFRFSPMPNFKASFVSSDGENPPPPLFLLKSGFYPSHVNFCKSVENVKVTGVERANMLEDA